VILAFHSPHVLNPQKAEAEAAVLEQDATAFDYDDVYESMKAPPKQEPQMVGVGAPATQEQQFGVKQATEGEKHVIREKPKYIRKLLEKAEEKKVDGAFYT